MASSSGQSDGITRNYVDDHLEEQENEDSDVPIVRQVSPITSGDSESPESDEAMASSNSSIFCANDENSSPKIVRQAPPVELPTQTRLKISVKRLHTVAEWKWITGNDDSCGICRMAFEACCVDCSMPGDGCPLSIGQCNHAFHTHCIAKWTEMQNSPKPQCPLCRQEWHFTDQP